MVLWMTWMDGVWQLGSAFRHKRTFLWAIIILASFSVRGDLSGVTSFIRCHWLIPKCYRRLLDAFHSKSVDPIKLRILWVQLVLKLFFAHLVTERGRVVLLADGIKAPKEGKKMPGVKCLHQEASSNSKPEYVMAHSCQAVSLLVKAEGSHMAVPLSSRIHEGVVYSNRDRKTLLDKLLLLIAELSLGREFYLVADAYYSSGKIADGLSTQKCDLISRVRSNAVAYEQPPVVTRRKKGRPKIFGHKVSLREVFKDLKNFEESESPIYGERDTKIRYHSRSLLWKPTGKSVLFVWVVHPTRGSMILMSTDVEVSPIRVIELYGLRFKIEVSFKQSLHTLGAYSYHFWMKAMDKIKRGSGDQYLHRKSKEYREKVRQKIGAYELHIQLGLIAQGMLQYLSVMFRGEIWSRFGSWLRTMRPETSPSETVTALALRNSFPEYLQGLPQTSILKKFLSDKIDWSRCPYFSLAG